MGTEDNGDMGFQGKVSGMAMSSGSMFKSLNRTDPFFDSGWDPIVSLVQSENFGGSSMVNHNEFANSPYPVVLDNHRVNSSSHLVHYPSDSGFGEMVPKLPCFGSGSFSEMVSSFGLPECGTAKTTTIDKNSQDDRQISEEEASPNGKRKRRASDSHSPFNHNKNGEGEQQKDPSGERLDEKKQKIEQNMSANLRSKQTVKQAKDGSNSGEAPKENYLHMRAKRGQATNSHSLAERVRRERISERMRLLQELVPGCNKITGKAVMLDEIINYVQSLQQQVEFLSMKLATVNPELNVDLDRILSKDILHSRGTNAAILGFNPGLSYSPGIQPGSLSGIPSTIPSFHAMPQAVWDNELHSLLQMGFDSNTAINNLGQNAGRSKLEQ